MKLNKISMMLAAAALVSCSDDLGERFTDQTLEDSRLIELGSNFVLSGVGQEGATTRTHWANVDGALVNQFLPIYGTPAPAINAVLGDVENLVLEKVGLCWLGQLGGENVYTNYEFYHFGWLNNDETEADVQCAELVNGAWYTDLKLTAAGTDDEEADVTKLSYTVAKGLITDPKDDLNLNSGVYKTDNKSIFGGDYIVYYPFNADFKEAGTIPAIAQTKFNPAPTSYDDLALGKATFRYSGKTSINGGDQAAGFGMKNLSSLVRVNVLSDDCSDCIDQIVLYSENSELLAQANLAADKIVAGAEGQALYASTEGTKTVVANFTAAGIKSNKSTTAKVFITALPTTVENLVVLVHNSTNSTWARVDMGETEIPAGSAMVLNVEVETADFNTDYIAVDEASLTNALTEANTWLNTALTADPTATATIQVIGDIELSSNLGITSSSYTNASSIIIQGDAIIVPQDVTLTVNTNMLSDIKVLGKSCCSGYTGGTVTVSGGTISNVIMEPTEAKVTEATYDDYNPYIEYKGAATVAAGSKVDVQAGNVVVDAIVSHKADFVVAEDAKVVVNTAGGLKFMGSTVVNNGTIEVKKNGQFDMKDGNGNASAADGQRMTNNGKFIHNVDAGVGTAVQKMNQNGEYRCRVNNQVKLDDAYDKWKACSVIEMVQTVANTEYNLNKACKHTIKGQEKCIDIEVNPETSGITTKFINPSASVNIGNLTVKSRLEITYNKTNPNASDLIVNGDCVSDANFVLTSIQNFKVTGDMTVNNGWVSFKASNSIDIKGNLTHNGDGTSQLNYYDGNSNLKVGKDITVNKAEFITQPKAMNVSCANFYLKNAAKATFGNRISGTTMTVSGTISNPAGCTFNIVQANTNPSNGLIAYITCNQLNVGGTFTNSEPIVE